MTRTTGFRAGGIILALVLGLTAPPARGGDSPTGGASLEASLEILRNFTYVGDPLLVRVSVTNNSESPLENTADIDLVGGLKVVNQGHGAVALKDHRTSDKRRPAVLAPGGFFGQIQDITSLARKPLPAGTYTISWQSGGVSASPVVVKVIPKFDPSAKYVAVMETDYGSLEFDLLSELAPKHVQNFYDLALQGVYDNTFFHQVIKGVEIRGGDPTGSGRGWPGYSIAPEISDDLTHERGTLSMLRMSGRNEDNGSQFVITLSAVKEYDGILSIFGKLRKGEDVLTALENIPTSGRLQPPYYKPLQPLVLRGVTVRKAAESGS